MPVRAWLDECFATTGERHLADQLEGPKAPCLAAEGLGEDLDLLLAGALYLDKDRPLVHSHAALINQRAYLIWHPEARQSQCFRTRFLESVGLEVLNIAKPVQLDDQEWHQLISVFEHVGRDGDGIGSKLVSRFRHRAQRLSLAATELAPAAKRRGKGGFPLRIHSAWPAAPGAGSMLQNLPVPRLGRHGRKRPFPGRRRRRRMPDVAHDLAVDAPSGNSQRVPAATRSLRLRDIRSSLLTRTVLAGAAVLALSFALLAFTPVQVSTTIHPDQAAILFGGMVAMIAIQTLLVRRALSPLRRLSHEMRQIDLRRPRYLLSETPDQGPEIAAFVAAFNEMVERLAEERRRSARAALLGQESERLRVARELHDEVGQSLTAVALEVERLGSGASGTAEARLKALTTELQKTLDDVRRIGRELRPEALDDLGLVNALIALVSRIDRQTDLRITRALGADLPALDSEQELVVYRVAQEALTNAVRHADAQSARLELDREGTEVVLGVSDDGSGLPDRSTGSGQGIEGMRERAMLVGASLEVGPQAGGGTRVRLALPVPRP
ncbi:MAG TPA: sensor histidine kinase [Solirubrobacterales bacterium]|nr:sensor histidine kinase [Solirubrobacterales bacterium]